MEPAATEVQNDVNLQDNGGRVVSMDLDPKFSGKPGDFAKDMAHLQAQSGEGQAAQPTGQSMTVDPPPVVMDAPVAAAAPTEPAQPANTPQAAATPEVPQKFQAPDGKLDEGKLAKSTQSAEEQLKKYLELEKTLRQKANEVSKLKQGYPAPTTPSQGQEQAPGTQAPAAPASDSFEARIEQDVKNEGLGPVLARLFTAASEQGYSRAVSDIEGIKTETELAKRERELSALAKADPWVFSQEGMEQLAAIRQARPWLAQHPEAWTEAYKVHLGEQAYRTRTAGQVQTPNPTAAKAPPAPIQAAPRSSGAAQQNFQSKEDVNAFLASMTPEQQDAFWVSKGLPALHKKGR